MTEAQTKQFEAVMAQMKAEDKARGEFFAARESYAIALGRGDATREQHTELLRLKSVWENMKTR